MAAFNAYDPLQHLVAAVGQVVAGIWRTILDRHVRQE
jgi:hypothetical protein